MPRRGRGRQQPGMMQAQPMRENAPPAPEKMLSQFHLDRMGLTQEEYTYKSQLQVEARKKLGETIRSNLSPAERHNAEAEYHITWGRAYHKCEGCWLHRGLCICSRVKAAESKFQMAVFMHHNEWGRGSNTGCLLRAALGAEIFVSGHIEQERALHERMAAQPSVLLWPGEDAVPAHAVPALLGVPAGEILAVVIDGTWNVAKKMVKRLPASVPRVAVSASSFPPGKSLLYPIRKYDPSGEENDNRVCTYEAVLAYEEEVGALSGAEREALLWNLKLKVDGVLKHKNRRGAYGTTEAVFGPANRPEADGEEGSSGGESGAGADDVR